MRDQRDRSQSWRAEQRCKRTLIDLGVAVAILVVIIVVSVVERQSFFF